LPHRRLGHIERKMNLCVPCVSSIVPCAFYADLNLMGVAYFTRLATKVSPSCSPTMRDNLISSPDIFPL